MLGNILRRLIKTEEIKDKKASDLVVLNVKDATDQQECKDIEVGEEILFNTALYKSAFSTNFLGELVFLSFCIFCIMSNSM